MEQSLRHMDELTETLHLDVPARCDADGNRK
jgi:hypothetical protein